MNQVLNRYQPWGLLAGRILLAYIFVLSGFGKIFSFAGTAGYMASKGMPMAEFFLVCAIVIELVGGLMLAVGWKARWGALALAVFVVPTTLIFHAYWTYPEAQVSMQQIQFNKNLAILGGMLYILFMGPGKLSLDKA
jgi:putative oxidoreductase